MLHYFIIVLFDIWLFDDQLLNVALCNAQKFDVSLF